MKWCPDLAPKAQHSAGPQTVLFSFHAWLPSPCPAPLCSLPRESPRSHNERAVPLGFPLATCPGRPCRPPCPQLCDPGPAGVRSQSQSCREAPARWKTLPSVDDSGRLIHLALSAGDPVPLFLPTVGSLGTLGTGRLCPPSAPLARPRSASPGRDAGCAGPWGRGSGGDSVRPQRRPRPGRRARGASRRSAGMDGDGQTPRIQPRRQRETLSRIFTHCPRWALRAGGALRRGRGDRRSRAGWRMRGAPSRDGGSRKTGKRPGEGTRVDTVARRGGLP